MEWVETTARTVEEAKEQALDRLGVGEEDAEFEVLDEPRAGQLGPVEVVGVAEQLKAAADAEDHRAAGGRGVQGVALDRREVLGAERLVAVLAAAHVVEVVRVGVQRLAGLRPGELETDAAPLAAALQEEQVAAVGVDVHQVRIQRAHPQHLNITTHDPT